MAEVIRQINMQEPEFIGKFNFNDDEALADRMGKGKVKTHISLFTGCGGMDVGMSQAGFESRVMIEFEKSCCETLRSNFLWEELKQRKKEGHYVKLDGSPIDKSGALIKNSKWIEGTEPRWKTKEEMKKDIDWYHDNEPVIFERDIKTVTTKEILKAAKLEVGQCSVISGGFPCQGFSLAGKRKVNDPRNALYQEFVRIVREAKPMMIIGENVPGLVSMEKGEIIKQICEDFAMCGYDIHWDILNAADYGVPQNRKRVFLIGKRVDAMTFREDGSMAITFCAQKGEIIHPELFYKRLKRWKKSTEGMKFKRINDTESSQNLNKESQDGLD